MTQPGLAAQSSIQFYDQSAVATWPIKMRTTLRLYGLGNGVELMHRAHILDQLPIGVAIIDQRAKVRYSNRHLSELLRACPELTLTRGTLTIHSTGHQDAFARALAQFASGSADAPVAFAISRPHRHPLSVVMANLPDSTRRLPATRSIMVIVCDPDFAFQCPVPLLRQLFDFTPTEAAVGKLMLQYKDTSRIAKELAISHETVRKHLQAMFAKTHSRNQAELLHILLFNPALLHFTTKRDE